MLIVCSSMREEVPQKQCYIDASVNHNFSMIHVSVLKAMNAVSEHGRRNVIFGVSKP
jgi:hypothetical protein